MDRKRRRWLRKSGLSLLLLGLAGPAGAQSETPVPLAPAAVPERIVLVFPPRYSVPLASDCPPVLEDEHLTLEKLLVLATRLNPELAAAEARVEAARGKLVQAGLYPNPMIGWEADDLFNNKDAAGEQGPFISQEIVTAGKLRLARSAAFHGVAAADWQAITRRFEIITRVRTAFYEFLAAEREAEALKKNLADAKEKTTLTERLSKAGLKVYSTDILRWEQETNQIQLQLWAAEQRRAAARHRLAVAVGLPSLPEVPIKGPSEDRGGVWEWEPLVRTVLTRSSELQHAQALVMQAQGELEHAQAEVIPNLHLHVHPFHSYPESDTQLKLQAGVALPVFNRNQGNILKAQAGLAQAHAEVRRTELHLTERLAAAFQRYETARRQLDLYTRDILPKAEELARKVRLGLDLNQYDTTALLEAQRGLYQARLAHLQAWSEYWRAVSEILGLLQVDDPAAACGLAPDR